MKIILLQTQPIHELGNRSNQEDSIYPKSTQEITDNKLFVVCDGMGGHEHGEVASKIVSETISSIILSHHNQEEILDDDILHDAVNAAYDNLDSADSTDITHRMGTTLALACFHKGGCLMAHMGDSRIYHIRPSEHRIIYKSRDHSLVYDLFQAGEITIDELTTYPKKNVITRAMMPHMGERYMASVAHTADIKEGDCFYLCSDGMLENMSDNDLLDVLCSGDSIEEKRQELIDKTINNADNHSAHIIYVEEVIKEDGDTSLPTDENIVKYNAINIEQEILSEDKCNEPAFKPRINNVTIIIFFCVIVAIILLILLMHIFMR